MAKKYERQATNKYYGAGNAGKVYTNTESDGLAKALSNSAIKFGNALSTKQDLKKDKAIAKINEMYASGKKFEDINSEILKGLHPELTGSYIDATTNYHKGRVLATEVMREIEANKNKYDINDTSQSLENFYKPYMPEFDGMDKSTILGFSTMFNNYKSKDALIDADNRSKNATRIKIDEGVSILDTVPTVNIKKDLAGEFNALKTPVPASDGSGKIHQLYTNKEAISVLVRSVDKVISLAETEADLDRADAILAANLGVGADGQAIASLGSRNSKEVLKLKEDLLKKRRALIINDRTNANQKEKEDVSALFASMYEQVPVSATAEMKGADSLGMREKNHVELMEIRKEFEKIGNPAFIANFDNAMDNNRFIDTDPAVYDQLVSDIFDGVYENQTEIADAIEQLNLDPKLLSSTLVLFDKWEKDFNKNRGNIHETNSLYKNGIVFIQNGVRGNFTNQKGFMKDNGYVAIRNAHNYMKREIFNFENNWDAEKNGAITDTDRDAFLQKLGDMTIKYFSDDYGVNPSMKTMPEYELEIQEELRIQKEKEIKYETEGVTQFQTEIAEVLETDKLELKALRDKVASGFDDGFFFSDTDWFDLDATDKQQYIDSKIVPVIAEVFKDVNYTSQIRKAMEQADFDLMKENIAIALGGSIPIEQIDAALKMLEKGSN